MAFCDKMTGFLVEARAVSAICTDFSKAFYTLSHSILVPRLGHYGQDGWATRWVKAWLDGQARGVMVTGQTLPGCVGLVGYHRSVLESVLFDSFISDLDEVRSVLSSSLQMTPS